jgi:hypothetical protein
VVDFARAFTYIFDDPQWTNKLIVLAIVTLLSIVLTPVLVGLLGFAILLGYEVELIRNVRMGDPRPLPRWDDYSRFLSLGVGALTGLIVYNLPNVIIGCVGIIVAANAGNTNLGGGLMVALSCCLLPLILIFNLAIQPIFTLALGRYSDDPRTSVFFEFGSLIALARQRSDAVIQWALATIIAGLILGAVGAIPCLGWIATAALGIPVTGSLAGQLAAATMGKPKRRS